MHDDMMRILKILLRLSLRRNVNTTYHRDIRPPLFSKQFSELKAILTAVARHIDDSEIWRVKKSIEIMNPRVLPAPNMSIFKQRFSNGPKFLIDTIDCFGVWDNISCEIINRHPISFLLHF